MGLGASVAAAGLLQLAQMAGNAGSYPGIVVDLVPDNTQTDGTVPPSPLPYQGHVCRQ